MITLDRSSDTSVHDQLVQQIRYLVASGHFQQGETLPSTRGLAKQLDVSFHTVRKAYQRLDQEGVLESQQGRGYLVREARPLGKAARLEQGAAAMETLLKHLFGLGLSTAEVEYLFHEQADLLTSASPPAKLVFAAPVAELAALGAGVLSHHLQKPMIPVPVDRLAGHADADVIFASFAHLGRARGQVTQADLVGVLVHLDVRSLRLATTLTEQDTLGLLCQDADMVPWLTQELRTQTAYSGQLVGASIERGVEEAIALLRQMDAVLYTPACARRLRPHLTHVEAHNQVELRISPESLAEVRTLVPT